MVKKTELVEKTQEKLTMGILRLAILTTVTFVLLLMAVIVSAFMNLWIPFCIFLLLLIVVIILFAMLVRYASLSS